MAEWNASEYYQRSALQKWLADNSLAGLPIKSQALLLGATFALSNAVDLVVGN